MSKIILVTGGARSGKSRYAEKIADELSGKVLYVATAKAIDEEMKDRIAHHRLGRPPEWQTFEGYKGFENARFTELAKSFEVVLVDCLTIMSSNILLDFIGDDYVYTVESAEQIERKVLIEVNNLMNSLEEAGVVAIFVTNEVGMGLVPEFPIGRLFRDISGRVNQRVADRASEVYFCVCGIPMKVK